MRIDQVIEGVELIERTAPSPQPLRLCDGKLGDLDTVVGECFADYERAAAPDAPAVLMREPWVQACLAGELPEVAQ